jgi:hypothetical protein
MSGIIIGHFPASDPRWSYDDPSGLPEDVPVTVHLPETLLASVQEEAARKGTTPSGWLLDLVERSLHPRPTAA